MVALLIAPVEEVVQEELKSLSACRHDSKKGARFLATKEQEAVNQGELVCLLSKIPTRRSEVIVIEPKEKRRRRRQPGRLTTKKTRWDGLWWRLRNARPRAERSKETKDLDSTVILVKRLVARFGGRGDDLRCVAMEQMERRNLEENCSDRGSKFESEFITIAETLWSGPLSGESGHNRNGGDGGRFIHARIWRGRRCPVCEFRYNSLTPLIVQIHQSILSHFSVQVGDRPLGVCGLQSKHQQISGAEPHHTKMPRHYTPHGPPPNQEHAFSKALLIKTANYRIWDGYIDFDMS